MQQTSLMLVIELFHSNSIVFFGTEFQCDRTQLYSGARSSLCRAIMVAKRAAQFNYDWRGGNCKLNAIQSNLAHPLRLFFSGFLASGRRGLAHCTGVVGEKRSQWNEREQHNGK